MTTQTDTSDNKRTRHSIGVNLILALCLTASCAGLLYISARYFILLKSSYSVMEAVFAFVLLGAETFILIHGLGYVFNIFLVVLKRHSLVEEDENTVWNTDTKAPPVAVVVSSYHEPLDVLSDTLTCFYNLTYPNKHLFLLDDTRYSNNEDNTAATVAYRKQVDTLAAESGVHLFRRSWRGAKAGMLNDFLAYLQGESAGDFELTVHPDAHPIPEDIRYIAVFDADQNPLPHFLESLVQRLEQEPKLAFVQTPQYYSNFRKNRIARASGLQQAVFYEYICEGKGITASMFCCGTNVLFRREALNDVGGFDESSVTEDFATSLHFHLKGWESAYHNRVLAFGKGPEDLGGYFSQQFRWAFGTVGQIRPVLKALLKSPAKLSSITWWEYLLSCTHYLVGLVFLVLMLCPVFFLFFDIPSYFAQPQLFVFIFIPYLVLTLGTFSITLANRGYRFVDVLTGQLLLFMSFPIYIHAAILALTGRRRPFTITPKDGSKTLSFRVLFPQILVLGTVFSAAVWGINRLVYEGLPFYGLLVNTLWCIFHSIILLSVLWFNDISPEERQT
jgi:cellulose synthase (UDP-forming)